jgi:hypothetical protein
MTLKSYSSLKHNKKPKRILKPKNLFNIGVGLVGLSIGLSALNSIKK